ncbi:MAG TPA: DUF4440 domain-containing protein [Pyrinomonadaceae bacterium]|jgi:ketosteroid isomerase-like protein|nr:DUF4440 domain-containing protein [Pyrinomonadaceae bacterium]
MNSNLEDFKEFIKQREAAAEAYVNGDAEPLALLSAEVSDATFFAPNGGFVQGARDVLSRYEADAKSFDSGSKSRFEILQMAASDEIAYWTGFQRAAVYFKGKPETVEFNLRITEIFRREGDDWKLVHRHADALAEENNK